MSKQCQFETIPSIQKVNRIPPRRRRRLRHHDDGSVMTSNTHSTCSTSISGGSSLSSTSRRSTATRSIASSSSQRSLQSTEPKPPSITTTQEIVTTRGINCICHVYHPPPTTTASPRGVLVIFHGLNAHGKFPTISHIATLVASQCNCIAYCLDFPGHGQSPGIRGHVTSAEDMVTDGMAVTLYAKKKHGNLPLFLAGQSLGGGIAALVAREFYVAGRSDSLRSLKEDRKTAFGKARSLMLLNCQTRNCGVTFPSKRPSQQRHVLPQNIVSGLILLAPLVSLAVPKWQRSVLKTLATLTPRAALFPPAENASEAQFNDPAIRKVIEKDDLSYRGNLRVSSALACLKITKRVGMALQEMTASTLKEDNGKNMPTLCVIGKNDMVVDNEALVNLLVPNDDTLDAKEKENDMPIDVALREYDAKHGLLCELEPVRGWIESDVVTWLSYRILPEEEAIETAPPSTLSVNRSKLRQLPTKASLPTEEEHAKRNLYDANLAARRTFRRAMAATERLQHQESSTPQTASPASSYSDDLDSPLRVERHIKRLSLPKEEGDIGVKSVPMAVTPPRRVQQRQQPFNHLEQHSQEHSVRRARSFPKEPPITQEHRPIPSQQRRKKSHNFSNVVKPSLSPQKTRQAPFSHYAPNTCEENSSSSRVAAIPSLSMKQHHHQQRKETRRSDRPSFTGDGCTVEGRYQHTYSLDGLEETQQL